MNKSKVLRYAIGPIGSAAIGFITLPIITWFYSIEDVGRISMLQVVASFSVLLFSLGLDQAYVREYHEAKDKPALFKVTVLPGFLLIVFSYSLLYLMNPKIISELLYGISSNYLSAISILCFILTFVSRFLSLILRMEERALAYSISQLLPKILFLLFMLSIVLLGFKKDMYSLVSAHVLSITSVFSVFLWNTYAEWLKALKAEIDSQKLKQVLLFGSPLVVGGLASWGLNVMDRLFLRSMSTFEELGVYAVTVSIAGAATIFAGIFNIIWSPMVYKWIQEGADLNKIDEVSEYLLAIIYFLIVLSNLFSWMIPPFLPANYAEIQYILPVCLFGPLLYTLSETTGIGITVARKTKLSMVASICAMLVNALGNYALVSSFGAAGAAVSTAFAFFIFYVLRTEFSRKVWRNVSNKNSYFLIILLFSTVVLNLLVYKGIFYLLDTCFMFFVWGALFIYGIFRFKKIIIDIKLRFVNVI